MLIGFLRRGRRVVLTRGSAGPHGPPDQPPFGFAWVVDNAGFRVVDNEGRRVVAPGEN